MQGVVHRIGLGQLLIQCRQSGLALDAVMLGRDVAERAHHDAAPGLGVLGMGDVRGDPHPVPIAVVHRNGVAAERLLRDAGERVDDQPVRFGLGVGVRPPRMFRRIRQILGPEAQDVGERFVDLDDGADFVADEERLLQGLHQRRAPAGVVAAEPGQFDVGAHAGQEFGGHERLDQIVVGAGLQAFDRGLLTGPRRQQ